MSYLNNYILNMRYFSTTNLRYIAKILNGKKLANRFQNELKIQIENWVHKGKPVPCLTAVLVGHDYASEIYIKHKMIASKFVGINSKIIHYPEDISLEHFLRKIDILNEDPKIHGIIIQLPLPKHLPEELIGNYVNPLKDVDGLHCVNLGHFYQNSETMVPCTASAVYELIKESGINTFSKKAVVVGRSKNVGMPIAFFLYSDNKGINPGLNMTTTICHRMTKSEDLHNALINADVVVSAVGKSGLIKASMLKQGVGVIDVGINRIPKIDTHKVKIVGDVDFKEVRQKADFITPVPGGVGPMTIAMIMRNTFLATQRIVNKRDDETYRNNK